MTRKRRLLVNILFTGAVLAAALFLLLWRQHKAAGNTLALEAQLTYGDDNTVLIMPLEKDAAYDVDTGYYTVHIKIESGAACFIDSPCPDHICENYGWISQADQTAICMPAHAVLMIVPKGS